MGVRRPGLGLCPKTVHCPLPLPAPVSGCPSFFFRPYLSVYLSLCVCLCVCPCLSVPYHSGCVCLSLPLQLSLPGFVPLHLFLCSLCLSLFPSTSLYPLCLSLQKCLSLSLSLSPPSRPPVLFLFSSLLPLGGCSSPTRQPGDTSGHCPGSTSRSPPHARHLGTDSVFPLQLWGVEGVPGREDTVPGICSGAPQPLTPSAAIKGAGSRGSER